MNIEIEIHTNIYVYSDFLKLFEYKYILCFKHYLKHFWADYSRKTFREFNFHLSSIQKMSIFIYIFERRNKFSIRRILEEMFEGDLADMFKYGLY